MMPTINNNSVPSQPKGSRTFWMGPWNIDDGTGGQPTQAAAGMVQMGEGLVVPMETKIIDNRYPKATSGYIIMCSKAVSGIQGVGCAHLEGGKPGNLRSNWCGLIMARILSPSSS